MREVDESPDAPQKINNVYQNILVAIEQQYPEYKNRAFPTCRGFILIAFTESKGQVIALGQVDPVTAVEQIKNVAVLIEAQRIETAAEEAEQHTERGDPEVRA